MKKWREKWRKSCQLQVCPTHRKTMLAAISSIVIHDKSVRRQNVGGWKEKKTRRKKNTPRHVTEVCRCTTGHCRTGHGHLISFSTTDDAWTLLGVSKRPDTESSAGGRAINGINRSSWIAERVGPMIRQSVDQSVVCRAYSVSVCPRPSRSAIRRSDNADRPTVVVVISS